MDNAAGRVPRVEVAAVVQHYGNVLLVKRAGVAEGRWTLPSSLLAWGDTIPLSIAREVLASTGITIRPGAVLHAYDRVVEQGAGGSPEHWVIIEVEGEYLGGELRRGGQVENVAWASGMALSTMEVDETTRGVLQDLGFIAEA